MRRLAFAFAVALTACAGASEPGETPAPWSCTDGVLVVSGPVERIEARYDVAPGTLLAHTAKPAAFITDEVDGWILFDLYEVVPAGDVATIETRDASTGAGLCPVDVRAE